MTNQQKIFFYFGSLILSLIVCVTANAAKLPPSLLCAEKGDPDGLNIVFINEHIISTFSGGVEIDYWRLTKFTKQEIKAEISFQAYPLDIANSSKELELTKQYKKRKNLMISIKDKIYKLIKNSGKSITCETYR